MKILDDLLLKHVAKMISAGAFLLDFQIPRWIVILRTYSQVKEYT